MKAVILAGGLGKRLRPLTHTGPKQLIPIANKPVLHYAIESIAGAGITDIGIVLGYTEERMQAIMHACGDGSRWGVHITYVAQDAPRGLAHAVWTAKGFLGGDDFVVFLGDNLIKSGIAGFMKEFLASDALAGLLLSRSACPEKFGTAELDDRGAVRRVEEKPEHPKTDLVITGVYFFRPKIFQYIAALNPSARGELELTHAIQRAIEAGDAVIAQAVDGWWDDAGTSEDVLHANKMVLSDLQPRISGTVEAGAVVTGSVDLGATSIIKKTAIVQGPVKIGEHCVIENARIGPYTSVGDNTRILSGTVESSILMGDCIIDIGGRKMSGSLVGKRCTIRAGDQGARLTVGEDSEILL